MKTIGVDRETLRVICTCIKGTEGGGDCTWRSFVDFVMKFCKEVQPDQEINWAVPCETKVVQFYTGAFVKMLKLDQNPDPCGHLCYSESDFDDLVEMWEQQSSTPRWDAKQRSSSYAAMPPTSMMEPDASMMEWPTSHPGTDATFRGTNPSSVTVMSADASASYPSSFYEMMNE